MFLARAALVFALALAPGLGCGTLDRVDDVHDLRLLGVRAEPPDQVLAPAVGAASADVSGAAAAGAPAALAAAALAATPLPVAITVLVADPAGAGRQVAFSLATCAQLDTGAAPARAGPPGFTAGGGGTGRCVAGSAQIFAAGTVTPTGGWAEVSGTLTPTPALLAAAWAADPYHGLDGLRLPVQVTVSAGSESVVGIKLVVFTLALPGRAVVANQNPVLAGVAVEGAPWPADAPLTLALGQPPRASGWQVQPLFDASLQVAYQLPDFSGGLLDLQELWQFDFFSTAGGLGPTTSGGQGVAARQAAPTAVSWLPAPGAPGPATLWVVVRDGRGGESWLTRTASLTP